MSKAWTPKPYMLDVVKFLVEHPKAGLFLDPGLGKTACTLAAACVLADNRMVKRVLVVGPKRVAQHVWKDERTKWTDFWRFPLHVLHGPKKDQLLDSLAAPNASAPDICTVTYDGLKWLTEHGGARLMKLGADMLVLDESTYIRHTNTMRFKALKPYLHTFLRRVILTGTPIPKTYEDLFGQIYALDQGDALGKYITHFRMTYFDNVGWEFPKWEVRANAVPLINERIRPLVLRGDADDWLDLPKLLHNTVEVHLEPKVRRIYDDLEKKFYAVLESGLSVDSPNAAALSGKLRQVANGFVYKTVGAKEFEPLHDEKLDALEDIVSSLQGKPAFLLFEFIADADRIEERLARMGVMWGRLGKNDKADEQMMKAFNAGRLDVLMAHPASAGHGLNLQESAGHVIWFGPTWNLEHYDQALRRVYRQGNPNQSITVHTIVATDTVEQRVAEVLSDRGATQRALLAALKRP